MDCMLLSSAVGQKHWHQLRPCLISIVPTQDCAVTRKVQPEVARRDGVSGVLGVNKCRIGAKFDDAGRVWVFGLLKSRSPHDINITSETDLSGEYASCRHMAYRCCIERPTYLP
jgi:hypothetical protein